jgi:hypothetical protein
MPDESWFPKAEIRLIFRHLLVSIAIGVAVGLAGRVFSYFEPGWQDVADLVEGFVFIGILVILGIKLLWHFVIGNGVNNALATA